MCQKVASKLWYPKELISSKIVINSLAQFLQTEGHGILYQVNPSHLCGSSKPHIHAGLYMKTLITLW